MILALYITGFSLAAFGIWLTQLRARLREGRTPPAAGPALRRRASLIRSLVAL